MPTYQDAPLDEVSSAAEAQVLAGNEIHQKFTCAACGDRVMVDEPNRIFTQGRHDDCRVEPGYITDLKVQGCNYLIVAKNTTVISEFDGETQHARPSR